MHIPKRCFLLIAALVAFSAACIADEQTLFTSEYSGKHSGLTVNLTKSLTQVSEHQYVMTSEASNFLGSLLEESHFLVIDETLLPVSYRYFRKIFGKKSDQRIIFDWENNTANYTRSDKPEKNKTFAVTRGILDPSLYQLKLQQELFTRSPIDFDTQNDTAHGHGQTFLYNYAKDGGIRDIEFAATERTEYELNGKTLGAIKVERINQRKNKQSIITLVPELNYQIAEIVHIDEDGKKHRVKLESYDANQDLMRSFYNRFAKYPKMDAAENLTQDKNNSLY